MCRSENPRNSRTRCSAILGLPGGNLLIDTSPDLRHQLLREQIGIVHAVLYTHEHADHVFGLDDLRLMQFYLGGPVPLYCEPRVEDRIRKSFDYAFKSAEHLHTGAVPQLVFRRIGLEPFEVLGAQVMPIRLKHGKRFDVLGFRFGNVAYCTDANAIPPESMERLERAGRADPRRACGHAATRRISAWRKRSRWRVQLAPQADVLHAHVRTSWSTRRRTRHCRREWRWRTTGCGFS